MPSDGVLYSISANRTHVDAAQPWAPEARTACRVKWVPEDRLTITRTMISFGERSNVPMFLQQKHQPGLLRDDGRRFNGLILVLRQNGQFRTCDGTVVDSLALSYVAWTSSHLVRRLKQRPYGRKSKYTAIPRTNIFVPVAMETLRPFNANGLHFKLATCSLPSPEFHERISHLVQRLNMIAFRGSFSSDTDILIINCDSCPYNF